MKVNVLAKNYSEFFQREKINEINSITITHLCYQLYLFVRDHNNMVCWCELCQGLINIITVLNLRNYENLLDIILKYDGEIDFLNFDIDFSILYFLSACDEKNKRMNCGHLQMTKQQYNKSICGFKNRSDLLFFLLNNLLSIKYSEYLYCQRSRRECHICSICTIFITLKTKF